MTTDRDTAAALRTAARALRDHADNTKTIGMVGQSYKLGVQDAALILTNKADDLDPDTPMDPPHQPQRLSDFPDPTIQTTSDLEPWDVPLGEGYEGPSILSTVELPQGRRFIIKRPPTPEPTEHHHTDDTSHEGAVVGHGWTPDVGRLPRDPGYRTAPVNLDWRPAPITLDTGNEPTGLVHGPRLGSYIDLTDNDEHGPGPLDY